MNKQLKDENKQSDKQKIKDYEKLIFSELSKLNYKLAKQIKNDIEIEFGSITKLCKLIVNDKIGREQLEAILYNIVFGNSDNYEQATRQLQYPRQLQYDDTDNLSENKNLDSYTKQQNVEQLPYSNNDNNEIQYENYKNEYNDLNIEIQNDFIQNTIENLFNKTIYIVWTDNTQGNSDILFSSSTDNGQSFSVPINISNNSGESFNPQMSVIGSNVDVIWTDNTQGNSDILFSSSTDNGQSFSVPINISNNSGESTQFDIIT